MKKILLLVICIFSVQFCYADEKAVIPANAEITKPANIENTVNNEVPVSEDEDIDKYFNEEPQQNPEQTVQLKGYLQYNQSDQEIEQQAIQLEAPETAKVQFSEPKRLGSKSLVSGVKKATFHPMQDELEKASKFATQEYNIKPVSTSFVQNIGNVSFGTMYDSSLDSTQISYSTGIFTKIEGKYFALKTAFSKNTNSNFDSYDDKIYFVPELKLTKRLSLLDVMQTDVYQINKKNEVVLRYSPNLKKYADEVQFELGAGQSYYQDNYIKSSVRFSTRFKL